nr:MAG TPA: hypothetical protein [Caudoviricetes sp.]
MVHNGTTVVPIPLLHRKGAQFPPAHHIEGTYRKGVQPVNHKLN